MTNIVGSFFASGGQSEDNGRVSTAKMIRPNMGWHPQPVITRQNYTRQTSLDENQTQTIESRPQAILCLIHQFMQVHDKIIQ